MPSFKSIASLAPSLKLPDREAYLPAFMHGQDAHAHTHRQNMCTNTQTNMHMCRRKKGVCTNTQIKHAHAHAETRCAQKHTDKTHARICTNNTSSQRVSPKQLSKRLIFYESRKEICWVGDENDRFRWMG